MAFCIDTAHRWRLRRLPNVEAHQPKAVAGMLEVDETSLPASPEKGSRKMTRPSRKRGGRATGAGRKAGDWVPVLVGRVRGQKFTAGKVLTRVTGASVVGSAQGRRPAWRDRALRRWALSPTSHLQRTLGSACQELRGELPRHR